MARSKIINRKSKPSKGSRRPHNARKPKPFRSVGELSRSIGAEPRRATLGGKEVVMSHAERLCRLTVEKAIAGSVSDLKLVIQTMADHPEIVAAAGERWVLLLAGDDAEL